MNIVICPSSQSIVIDIMNYTKKVLQATEEPVQHASAPVGGILFTVNENSTKLNAAKTA